MEVDDETDSGEMLVPLDESAGCFCFFIFIRRFWNQIFTWRSVRPSSSDSCVLRGRHKYLNEINLISL